ncbi:hypothetical protein [Roseateles oligotrophus]|uniref:Lipoprotein n=1 Tax=Roseateles oligotrophus TaxID=1769250 RepID=A0ABT2YJX2_9BURK|nr:hypothetical protein [Roseateles oligotrophus]MCV2370350.1 hypothetical protein [Roseateles oligotrophus]
MTSRFLLGLILLIGLAACGTATDAPNLALSPQTSLQMRGWVPDRLKGQILLSPVTGGQPTGFMWGSKISNAALQEAIEESLRATGMLALRPGAGAYQMDTQLIELEQPMLGLNTKVALTLAYTVVEKRSGTVVYQRRLRSLYATEFTEAMVDPNERLRLATEGAVRSNVNLMLRDLIALALN